jgi:methylglyoxal synthase
MPVRPVVALVATPEFKKRHREELRRFVYQHLYTLTSHFKVVSTGRTYDDICDFIDLDFWQIQRLTDDRFIAADLETRELTQNSLRLWRETIKRHFIRKSTGVMGMIEIANELVEGRLEAVIQFNVEDDTTVRAGSAALQREANVHDIPIASDIDTAGAFVRFWKSKLGQKGSNEPLFRDRPAVKRRPFAGLRRNSGSRVLALIAHDGQKEAMASFVSEHSQELRYFGHILATGHSGDRAAESLRSAGWTDEELRRILPCNPGPMGGDVQIAAAVIRGLCRNVLFFQDPAISQPHQADIRLFEQAILAGIDVRLATNSQSARILLAAVHM